MAELGSGTGHLHNPSTTRKRPLDKDTQETAEQSYGRIVESIPRTESNSHTKKRHRLDRGVDALKERTPGNTQCLILHRVQCNKIQVYGEDHADHALSAIFLDVPRLFCNDTRGSALRGQQPVHDTADFLDAHQEYSIVIYREYSCRDYHASLKDRFASIAIGNIDRKARLRLQPWFHVLEHNGEPAVSYEESMYLHNELLEPALVKIIGSDSAVFGTWNGVEYLKAPYRYFYHTRVMLGECAVILDPASKSQVKVLLDYLEENCRPKFDAADALFEEGLVSRRHLSKLYKLNDVIVTDHGPYPLAYMLESLAETGNYGLELGCWSWEFDGSFKQKFRTIDVNWTAGDLAEIEISDLGAWPLRLDRSDLQHRLEARGQTFWNFRHGDCVDYITPLGRGVGAKTTTLRYRIDYQTYQQLHLEPEARSPASQDSFEITAQLDVDSREPPDPSDYLLLPATILGYGFHDKKWKSLFVSHISPVSWNPSAFERLVLKSHKKDLIRALVSVHLSTSKTADVVEGKGNGLIILLHGSPGTGKTLTAEGVAEIAKRPLYRVTCGDIGTDIERVEEYLASVLFVGSTWGCVVLLDEADVFLEERTPADMVRNALVSVFLRVLEYYDGILILTSNRVGTFDEAFKSRVQLAVHYPKLDEPGRFEIWQNFIADLRRSGVDMNFEAIANKMTSLAHNFELNGRQIRNVVQTAKQFAEHKGERLEYSHLEMVIDVSKEFEDYLVKARGHADEVWAREVGVRNEID